MTVDLAPVATATAELMSNIQLPELNGQSFDLNAWLMFTALAIGIWAAWSFIAPPLRRLTSEVITSNWRLALLGATGIVLSVASGWTTWDGMRNFTQEPVLSLLITFGIQGVMLIVAWLIGESFATGMVQRPAPRTVGVPGGARTDPTEARALLSIGPRAVGTALGTAIGLILFAILAVMTLQVFGADEAGFVDSQTLSGASNQLLFAVALVVIFAAILFGAGSAVWSEYAQAARIMVRSAVLWLMFLACMATSVFFSFDSLFSTIFPQDERKRAAELRAQNQVAGVVNDISNIATKRRIQEAESLFTADGWARYESELNAVTRVANRAPEAIRKQIAAELEVQRQRVATLEEKKASARSGQAGLAANKIRLTEELSRVQAARPEAAAKVGEFKGVVSTIERRLDEQRAVVLAEERGVEGSGKVGRGPMWRAARAEQAKIMAELEVAKRRLKGHNDRLVTIDKRISTIKAELAQSDGDLARLNGEAQTADQLISVAKTNDNASNIVNVDPAAGVAALERARQTFRQSPTQATLLSIQTRCQSLQNAALKVQTLRDEAARVNCDPGSASEAAARVFALNTGIQTLEAKCIGGDKLPQTGGADALFAFARGCVQDSGLPSDATDELRTRINLIELNRDDKAHRFVVTVNAFEDGNKLAYLALAIAIAIDAMVFMSGLFGANAVRSPLSDVPSHKGRSAQQLEAIVENALMPHTFENATMTLERIQPISHAAGTLSLGGWTHEAVIPVADTAERARLIKVLNAGATIGAVARDPEHADRFIVRGEFVEFLSIVAKKAFTGDQDKVRLAELKKILVVALQPYVGDHAEIVLGYLRPISERDGYSCEVCIHRDIDDPSDRFIVQKAINAGTTLDFVQKDTRKGEDDRFYMHRDFYRTLATVAAEYPKQGLRAMHPQLMRGPDASAVEADYHGVLQEHVERVETHVGHERQIEDQTQRSKKDTEDYRERFRTEFIAALLNTEEDYGWAQNNVGMATAANRMLSELVQADQRLGPLVEDMNRTADATISRVYHALVMQYDAASDHARQLLDVRKNIETLAPLMALAPGGRYRKIVTQAIEELEAAAGRDDGLRPDEQDVLNRLKAHVTDIKHQTSAEAAIHAIEKFVESKANGSGDTNVAPFLIHSANND
ncbi:MAG: hypothetical protein AAGC70_01600 [Pseudomonadota bacterium]